jgi:hypothetical protein
MMGRRCYGQLTPWCCDGFQISDAYHGSFRIGFFVLCNFEHAPSELTQRRIRNDPLPVLTTEHPAREAMKLTVKTLKGGKFTVEVEPSNTVGEAKGIIVSLVHHDRPTDGRTSVGQKMTA